LERRLVAILTLDVVGFSRLMGNDEAGTVERLNAVHKDLVQPRIRDHGGRVVKLMGDGLLAEFGSVVEAVGTAVSIQQDLYRQQSDSPVEDRIELRIGVNLGDVIVEGTDIFGNGVNVAARLEQLAPSGGICISGDVHDQVDGKVDGQFEDLGEHTVKNIARPVRVWQWTNAERPDRPSSNGTRSPAVQAGKASLAVLPFANRSSDPELDFLADGLTEDITTLLARLPGFLVIAYNSSIAFKGKSPDVREVGRALDVAYVVEGSLRPLGDTVRLTVQLIDTATGKHHWANRFDQPADQIDALQDEITIGVASRLEPELAKAEIERLKKRGDINTDAWGCYRQASGLLSLKGWHRETFAEATKLLSKAIELDPDFALAHAYLSLIYALGHMFDLSPVEGDTRAAAVQTAERAMELDSHDASVLGYAGCALSDVGLTTRGIETLERAIETDPSNAQAWVALGTSLLRTGKATKGIEMLRHGMRISPLDNRLSFWGTNLAYALLRKRHFDQAEKEARLACRRDGKNYMAKIVLALILLQRGQPAPAKEAVDEARLLRPGLTGEDIKALIGGRGVRLLDEAALLD